MKIAWLMDKELDAASDRAYISTLSRHLEEIGIHVRILARYREQSKLYPGTEIEYIDTPPIKLVKRTLYLLKVAIRLLSLCSEKNEEIDIVVVDRPTLAFATLPALFVRNFQKRNCPRFVLDVRSLPSDPRNGVKGRLSWATFSWGLKLAGRLFDGCLAITPAMASYIGANSSFKESQIGLWSSAFDADLFDPETAVADGAFEQRQRVTLVYHGAVAPNRMLIETIEALAVCSSDIEFVLIGNGALLPALKIRTAELGLTSRVTFMEPVDYERVPGLLKSADIGIVPIPDTLWFKVSMPIKLLEYMAMKLPIVAPLTTPVETVIGKSACDIEPFDVVDGDVQPKAIASAIDKAVSRWGKGYVSDANRRRVLHEYSWDAQARKIHRYLSNLGKHST